MFNWEEANSIGMHYVFKVGGSISHLKVIVLQEKV